MDEEEKRQRKFTEKGLSYQLDIRQSERSKQLKTLNDLCGK